MANRFLNVTWLVAAFILVLVSTRARAQAPFHLQEGTIDQIRGELMARRMSCRDLIGHYLKRIEAYDHAGPSLNAVHTVNHRALDEADRLDAMLRASGPAGPLHCIPVLVKDQVETSDMPTTYGSVLFKQFTPRRDATVVKKLKASGAIVIGKTNMGGELQRTARKRAARSAVARPSAMQSGMPIDRKPLPVTNKPGKRASCSSIAATRRR